MTQRIIVDGIRIEGAEAKRLVDEVLRGVDETGAARRRFPLGMLSVTAVCAGVASGVTALALELAIGGVSKLVTVIVCMVVAAVIGVVWVRVYMRLHRRQFRRAMRRRGFELCTGCGYWLKGLGRDVARCPECGRPREMNDGVGIGSRASGARDE